MLRLVAARTIPITHRQRRVSTLTQAGGYGVGVAYSNWSLYRASIAARIARGLMPWSFICITARVTPRQTPQVGAIGSSTTEPSALTSST
jgi:hypothetical protein